MVTIHERATLDDRLREQEAVLLLFGGQSCGVCQALKPQLEAMLRDQFPAMAGFYLDCQGGAQALCAQEGIFALPVVQLWFGGRKFAEFARVFSLGQLREAIARPYALAFGAGGPDAAAD